MFGRNSYSSDAAQIQTGWFDICYWNRCTPVENTCQQYNQQTVLKQTSHTVSYFVRHFHVIPPKIMSIVAVSETYYR